MVTTALKALVDESETLLASIRSGIIVHVQDGLRPSHLKAPLAAACSLNANVAKIGDTALADGADTLEAWVTLLASETNPISHTRTLSLLDQISDVEVALISYKAGSGAPSLDVAEFVDETFDNLRLAHNEAAAPRRDDEPVFETDAELMDVFREESSALLQNIQEKLDVLFARPDDRDALWEIKRSAHTFKGAAGIIGMKRSSELAHRVEDLLERVSEKDGGMSVDVFELLSSAAKCLRRLADGEDSDRLDTRLTLLHGQFADAMQNISDSVNGSPNNPPIGGTPAEPAVEDAPTEQTAAHDTQAIRNRSVVRVSLDRLDELAKQVHDLAVIYPVFEQELAAFHQQMEESCDNTARLQAASGRMQNFEAPPLETATGAIWEHVRRLEFRQNTYELSETVRDAEAIDLALDEVRAHFGSLFAEQEKLITEIQKRLMRLRKVEFGTVATRLQRTVRVTCDEEKKTAEVIIENASVEIDTQVIDSLIEPLMHLLKNAVVHGIESAETRRMLAKPEAGTIRILVEDDDVNVILTVADDGRGISFQPLLDKALATGLISAAQGQRMSQRDMEELIFLPGLTTAEKLSLNAGRGVGMSIVRESVAALNGTVSVETYPQKGTAFRLCVPHPFAQLKIPAQVAAEERTHKAPPAEFAALVVDDSPSVRLMTSRILTEAGWHADTAKNGVDALEYLKNVELLPNVILSDLEMPKMNGLAFVSAVREDEKLKDIPVVFITSKTDSLNIEKAHAIGATEYITKPYRERDLINLLNRLAERGEQVRAGRLVSL